MVAWWWLIVAFGAGAVVGGIILRAALNWLFEEAVGGMFGW